MKHVHEASFLLARVWLAGGCAMLWCATTLQAQTNLGVTVRHAPSLNGPGRIEGSAQQLLGESVTLNGGFTLTGDLLVPPFWNFSIQFGEYTSK